MTGSNNSRSEVLFAITAVAVLGAGIAPTLGQNITISPPATGPAATLPAGIGTLTLTSPSSTQPAATTQQWTVETPGAGTRPAGTASSFTGPLPIAGAAATGPGAVNTANVTQPFIATITGDRVYVRSGAGTAYYEIGQLTKGDHVYVVGAANGWYKILPPNGTYCLVAKEYVDAGPAANNGTIKGDYINIRAGTAENKSRDPSAVLTVVRKGTPVHIIGQTDKYYEIAPPDRAYVFVSPQFVKEAAAGTEYVVPTLKLKAGATGPAVVTVTAPVGPVAPAGVAPVARGGDGGATSVVGGATTVPAGGTQVVEVPATLPGAGGGTLPDLPIPQPARIFSETATARFNELTARFQVEDRKPVLQREVDTLIKDYKALLAMENLSPSVKAGSESHIAALEKIASIQRLSRERADAEKATNERRDALQKQFAQTEREIAEAMKASPRYEAEGLLQASTIVKGQFALVNPETQRVVAYVDPSTAKVDIGVLVGKYIAVQGTTKMQDDRKVIQVTNAILTPDPTQK